MGCSMSIRSSCPREKAAKIERAAEKASERNAEVDLRKVKVGKSQLSYG